MNVSLGCRVIWFVSLFRLDCIQKLCNSQSENILFWLLHSVFFNRRTYTGTEIKETCTTPARTERETKTSSRAWSASIQYKQNDDIAPGILQRSHHHPRIPYSTIITTYCTAAAQACRQQESRPPLPPPTSRRVRELFALPCSGLLRVREPWPHHATTIMHSMHVQWIRFFAEHFSTQILSHKNCLE